MAPGLVWHSIIMVEAQFSFFYNEETLKKIMCWHQFEETLIKIQWF